jgi:hypothetical protein
VNSTKVGAAQHAAQHAAHHDVERNDAAVRQFF